MATKFSTMNVFAKERCKFGKVLENLSNHVGTEVSKSVHTALKKDVNSCIYSVKSSLIEVYNGLSSMSSNTGSEIGRNLMWGLPSYVHEAKSFAKKIAQAKKAGIEESAFDPFFRLCVNFQSEMAELDKMLASMTVVSVRKPSSNQTTVAKVSDKGPMGTCPVCFNLYHTRHGLMPAHGFKRSELGFGPCTQSCNGTSFKPYEVSKKGTVWALNNAVYLLETCHKTLADEGAPEGRKKEARKGITINKKAMAFYQKKIEEWKEVGM